MLEIACGAAKNRFPTMKRIVGIGIEPPRTREDKVAEDFILLPCEEWPDEARLHYEEANRVLNFFGTSSLREYREHVTQFVAPPRGPDRGKIPKVGRNDPCPCGSGKKYKKCHLGTNGI
jgi:preprotein translocase subunit SecA